MCFINDKEFILINLHLLTENISYYLLKIAEYFIRNNIVFIIT